MLLFVIGENEVTGQVANLRRVAWDSFQVNFFMIGKPSMLERYPATFITSFYLPDNRAQFAGDLVFVPEHFGHATLNLADVVSVAVEFD